MVYKVSLWSPDHPRFPSPVGPFPRAITHFLFLPPPTTLSNRSKKTQTPAHRKHSWLCWKAYCLSLHFQSWLYGFPWHVRARGRVCSGHLPLPPSVLGVALSWVLITRLFLGHVSCLHLDIKLPELSCHPLQSSCILGLVSNVEWKLCPAKGWKTLVSRELFLQKGPFTWDSLPSPLADSEWIMCCKDIPSNRLLGDRGGTVAGSARKINAYIYPQQSVKRSNKTNRVSLDFREQIRQGLEELQKVLPGGDTYMHEGFERVIINWFSTLNIKCDRET